MIPTEELFLQILKDKKTWVSYGLDENQRKHYLQLQKKGKYPERSVMEKRLKEAGFQQISSAKVISAIWK